MKTKIIMAAFWLLFFTNIQIGAIAQAALSVEKVTITVSDLKRSVDFYTQVLDFQKVNEYQLSSPSTQKLFGLPGEMATATIAVLKLGDERIELLQFSGTVPGRPIPSDSRSNDGWFQHIAIVVSDMDKAYQKVRTARAVHVSTAPQILPGYLPAAAGISAFYFRDPDGHNLELIHFPKGKGNPKWQPQSSVTNHQPLFLGIDHTAIGIKNTDNSYAFWQDVLGLEIGGHSENFGTEQEHLNQIFGARLYITGLHAKEGMGVEFLDYIAPPGGRPYPSDSNPNDLWHWHTTLIVNNLEQIFDKLRADGFKFISNGITVQDNGTQLLLVRDADGHAVLLEEPAPLSEKVNSNR